jgi:RraA family protein
MIGFRIHPLTRRVASDWVEKFVKLPVANVSDAMSRMSAAGAALRPIHRSGVLCGPALTVKTRPGDNLMLQKALDMAEPGDVIVCDGGGALDNALLGGLMAAHAKSRGIAGLVINGAIRDYAELSSGDFPVFAAGVTHRGPYKDGPGEINVPVSFGGMVITPGDLILGDADGVISVGFDDLDEVFRSAAKKNADEAAQMVAISEGRNRRDWIDEALNRLGVGR